MKTSYRGTEASKLIDDKSTGNQTPCLTAKEPISYSKSLKIDGPQNKKSIGESTTCIQESSNCKSVTYYVDDPDSHCQFTEVSGSAQMMKENNNRRELNFDEFD